MDETRTIVSGGTGFVGRFIVEALVAAGHDVTVAGRREPEPGFFSAQVGFRSLDLNEGGVPAGLFQGADHFVHAAFDHLPGKYRGGEGDDAQGFRRRNLDVSVRLFDAAKAAGVKRTVFLSSRAVYGTRAPGETLREEMEARPDTLYGEVKLAAEKALLALGDEGFVASVLRVTGVYGPAGKGQTQKWAPLFADYLAGRKVAPRAATEVHGRDVGEAVRLMLEGSPADRVFNVSDILVDRRDILAIVKDVTGCPHPLPEAADKTEVNAMATDRIEALGWRPGGLDLFEETVAALVQEEHPRTFRHKHS
jgi:nucleoside-diphosphate-sugar epimerase